MERRVHQSLLRRPYFLDLPPEILVLEIGLYLGLLGLFGPRPLVILLGFVLLLPFHLAVGHLTRDEPHALTLLSDALGYRSFYPAHGALLPLPELQLRSSIPRI